MSSCSHRHPDGSECMNPVSSWATGNREATTCWAHRPRKPQDKQDEKRARLAKRLAEEARHGAAVERNAAREKYDKLEEDLVCAVLDMEAVLPKKLRVLCAALHEAGAAWEKADEVLDARSGEATRADDEYETARNR